MSSISSLSLNQPNPGGPGRQRPESPRPQYIELKANVHRKLLNRLNLEALANADRSRAESEIRTLVGELLAEEATPVSLSERDILFSELVDEVFHLRLKRATSQLPNAMKMRETRRTLARVKTLLRDRAGPPTTGAARGGVR